MNRCAYHGAKSLVSLNSNMVPHPITDETNQSKLIVIFQLNIYFKTVTIYYHSATYLTELSLIWLLYFLFLLHKTFVPQLLKFAFVSADMKSCWKTSFYKLPHFASASFFIIIFQLYTFETPFYLISYAKLLLKFLKPHLWLSKHL